MTHLIFSVYDAKALVYSNPWYSTTKGAALRAIIDVAQDNTHPIGKHPTDYTLFYLGEYDDSKGSVNMLPSPENLGTIAQIIGVKK